MFVVFHRNQRYLIMFFSFFITINDIKPNVTCSTPFFYVHALIVCVKVQVYLRLEHDNTRGILSREHCANILQHILRLLKRLNNGLWCNRNIYSRRGLIRLIYKLLYIILFLWIIVCQMQFLCK